MKQIHVVWTFYIQWTTKFSRTLSLSSSFWHKTILTLEATFSSSFCLYWLNLSNLRNFNWLFCIIFSCHFPTMCVMPVKGNGFEIYLAYKAAIRVKLFMLLSSSSLLLNSWLEIFINSLKENLWWKNFFISSQVYSFT